AEADIDAHIRGIAPEQRRVPDQALQGGGGGQDVFLAAVVALHLDQPTGLAILVAEKVQAVAVFEQALEGDRTPLAPLALGAELLLARLQVRAHVTIHADQPGQARTLAGRLDGRGARSANLAQGVERQSPALLALEQIHQGRGVTAALRSRAPELPAD